VIISDPAVLAEFRGDNFCEWCGRRRPCCPAHVFARGLGSRIDHRLNLAALCLECHTNQHNGARPTQDDLLNRVAWREEVSAQAIREWIWLVRRTPKEKPIPPAPARAKREKRLDVCEFEPPF